MLCLEQSRDRWGRAGPRRDLQLLEWLFLHVRFGICSSTFHASYLFILSCLYWSCCPLRQHRPRSGPYVNVNLLIEFHRSENRWKSYQGRPSKGKGGGTQGRARKQIRAKAVGGETTLRWDRYPEIRGLEGRRDHEEAWVSRRSSAFGSQDGENCDDEGRELMQRN